MLGAYNKNTTNKVLSNMKKLSIEHEDYIMRAFLEHVQQQQPAHYLKYDLRGDVLNELAKRYCTDFNNTLNKYPANLKNAAKKIAKQVGEIKFTQKD